MFLLFAQLTVEVFGFSVFQRGVDLVKTADEEVADQTVEKTGVLLEDVRKPITQSISGLVC
jgi:hypothetical protein